MRFKKYDIVTAGTDDNWRGTIADVKDEHEADPLYLVAFHKHPAEWIRGHYLYRVAA